VHARRLAAARLSDATIVKKLFDEIGPRYAGVAGGFTRVLKLGTPRVGDNAPMAVIELALAQGEAPRPPKEKTVAELKSAAKTAKAVYIATDPDREGEAIAWHLREVLKPQVPVKRMVFHEITQEAIDDAIANPRGIDTRIPYTVDGDGFFTADAPGLQGKSVITAKGAGIKSVADLKGKELLERRHARLDGYGRFTDTKADAKR